MIIKAVLWLWFPEAHLSPWGSCVGKEVTARQQITLWPSAWFNFALAPGGRVQEHRVITRLLPGRGGWAGVSRGVDILDVEAPSTWADLEKELVSELLASRRSTLVGLAGAHRDHHPGHCQAPLRSQAARSRRALRRPLSGGPCGGKPGAPKNPIKYRPTIQTCTPDLTPGGKAS